VLKPPAGTVLIDGDQTDLTKIQWNRLPVTENVIDLHQSSLDSVDGSIFIIIFIQLTHIVVVFYLSLVLICVLCVDQSENSIPKILAQLKGKQTVYFVVPTKSLVKAESWIRVTCKRSFHVDVDAAGKPNPQGGETGAGAGADAGNVAVRLDPTSVDDSTSSSDEAGDEEEEKVNSDEDKENSPPSAPAQNVNRRNGESILPSAKVLAAAALAVDDSAMSTGAKRKAPPVDQADQAGAKNARVTRSNAGGCLSMCS
jgi:hypothetical protein